MNDLAILDASTPAVISAETRDDLKRTSKSNLARVARLRGGRRDLEPVIAKVSGDKERAGLGARRVASHPSFGFSLPGKRMNWTGAARYP